MCHCNPAPPNCPPGEIYNAICLPGWEVVGVMLGVVVLSMVITVVMGWYPEDSEE